MPRFYIVQATHEGNRATTHIATKRTKAKAQKAWESYRDRDRHGIPTTVIGVDIIPWEGLERNVPVPYYPGYVIE